MPGNSPHEAVQAFVEPLIEATAVLDARTDFEIVRCDARHEGVYRVSTRGYRYRLRRPDGSDAWRLD